mmetsp:Transcript_140997/g.351630  ORF Transcript_140997/g.351630 Transcript_140997/m.351630 type:complete len:145 (-) Transcript_140997:1092-1526(-)
MCRQICPDKYVRAYTCSKGPAEWTESVFSSSATAANSEALPTELPRTALHPEIVCEAPGMGIVVPPETIRPCSVKANCRLSLRFWKLSRQKDWVWGDRLRNPSRSHQCKPRRAATTTSASSLQVHQRQQQTAMFQSNPSAGYSS